MNGDFALLVNLAIAIGLGALVGAEREVTGVGKKARAAGLEFSGLRTFTLISLLGFASAYLADKLGVWALGGMLLIVGAFLLAEYWRQNFLGITSEMAALATFLVGAVAFASPLIATVIGVAIVLILATKKWIRDFLQHISEPEFLATIKFIIVAFIILPVLPNVAVDPWGIVSPRNAWLMVVFISAISFVGYVLTKVVGSKRGLALTGIVGGLASSTAVASSMASESKRNPKITTPFTIAIILASAVMLVRVGFEVFVLNRALLPQLALSLGMMTAASALVLIFLWQMSSRADRRQKSKKGVELSSPFSLSPALKFAAFYVVILFVAHFSNKFFGASGVYATAAFSGLADVDAITISLSRLAGDGSLAAATSVNGITIAVLVNTLVKLSIVQIFGDRKTFRQALVSFAIIIAAGLTAIFVF
ncbi:MAG: MgtC/SapB family protein [Patescibacteria group bacterium]